MVPDGPRGIFSQRGLAIVSMSYDLLVARREHLRFIGRTNGEEAVAGARRFRVPRIVFLKPYPNPER